MGRSKRTAKNKSLSVAPSISKRLAITYEVPSTPSIEFRVGLPESATPPDAPQGKAPLIEDLGYTPNMDSMKNYTILFATNETYIKMFAALQTARRFVPITLVDVRTYHAFSAVTHDQALYKMNPGSVTHGLLKEFSDSEGARPIPRHRFDQLLANETLYDKGGLLKPFEVVVSVLRASVC